MSTAATPQQALKDFKQLADGDIQEQVALFRKMSLDDKLALLFYLGLTANNNVQAEAEFTGMFEDDACECPVCSGRIHPGPETKQ